MRFAWWVGIVTFLASGLCLAEPTQSRLRLGYYSESYIKSHAYTWNLLTLGYALTDRLQADLLLHGDLNFTGAKRWGMGNPRVGVSSLILSERNILLWGNVNLELPLTSASRNAGTGIAPGSYFALWIYPTASAWSFGLQHTTRYYPYKTSERQIDVTGNVRPAVSRHLGKQVYGQFTVSIDYHHIKARGWKRMNGDDVALEPGLFWVPMENLNLRPYLALRPAPTSLQRAEVGLWMNWAIH